jgi:hypothetical protein
LTNKWHPLLILSSKIILLHHCFGETRLVYSVYGKRFLATIIWPNFTYLVVPLMFYSFLSLHSHNNLNSTSAIWPYVKFTIFRKKKTSHYRHNFIISFSRLPINILRFYLNHHMEDCHFSIITKLK